MAKQEIAEINEHVDDNYSYCREAKSTASHLVWECPFCRKIREDQDQLLASVPGKYILPCIRCGIEPALEANESHTSWGQYFDVETKEAVTKGKCS